MAEFCKCGSLIVNSKCSAKCKKRKPVKWGKPDAVAMNDINTLNDPITYKRRRRSDLGGKPC